MNQTSGKQIKKHWKQFAIWLKLGAVSIIEKFSCIYTSTSAMLKGGYSWTYL